jgi:hypothetical protein
MVSIELYQVLKRFLRIHKIGPGGAGGLILSMGTVILSLDKLNSSIVEVKHERGR